MKVGDLVKYKSSALKALTNTFCNIGIIVETGIYVGNRDVKVCWDGKNIYTEYNNKLEVINENN